jgi:hypothetical protein
MLFFWLIPLVVLAALVVVMFVRRVMATSSVHSDAELTCTDDARRERRNELNQ